jgi:hypothetical protein
MTHASVLTTLLIAALFYQGGGLVVPTKITAKPPDSFSRGNSVTFQATFAANRIPPIKAGPCQHPGFAIRLYDAKLVENEEGPRISPDTTHLNAVKPVTPYIQESVAPFEPLSGPDALTIEKTFEPLKFPAKKTARLKRIYVGLFRTCDLATPKDIDETLNIIYDDALSGSYIGGSFFKLDCPKGSMCIYRPE